MNRAPTLAPVLLVAAVLTSACGRGEVAAPAATEPAAAAAAQPEAVVEGGAPKIIADEAVHDFGAIALSGSVEHVFQIRNGGTADLKIERVQKT